MEHRIGLAVPLAYSISLCILVSWSELRPQDERRLSELRAEWLSAENIALLERSYLTCVRANFHRTGAIPLTADEEAVMLIHQRDSWTSTLRQSDVSTAPISRAGRQSKIKCSWFFPPASRPGDLGSLPDKPPSRGGVQGVPLSDFGSHEELVMSYEVKPLPFDVKTLNGLSRELITSHYAKNYSGAVARLNAARTSLHSLDWSNASRFTINGLRSEELITSNSAFFHELYFDSFGEARALKPGGLSVAFARDYGSMERWEAEFKAVAKAQSGGSGWMRIAKRASTSRHFS